MAHHDELFMQQESTPIEDDGPPPPLRINKNPTSPAPPAAPTTDSYPSQQWAQYRVPRLERGCRLRSPDFASTFRATAIPRREEKAGFAAGKESAESDRDTAVLGGGGKRRWTASGSTAEYGFLRRLVRRGQRREWESATRAF